MFSSAVAISVNVAFKNPTLVHRLCLVQQNLLTQYRSIVLVLFLQYVSRAQYVNIQYAQNEG